MKKIIAIADWAADTLTNQEFLTAIEGYAKYPAEVRVTFVASTPSTIHTGFLIRQLIYTEERLGRPNETILFHNTDPRLQSDHSVEAAQGAQFLIARLANGMFVCGPNAGYVYSLIKSEIEELFVYPGVDKGSQFRSRDTLSRIVAHLADYMEDEMQFEGAHKHLITDIQKDTYYVGHIDNFGNMKTTLTVDNLKGAHSIGDIVKVTIGKVTRDVQYVTHMFAAHPGDLVMFPGSSGNLENPYMEVSVWRHFDTGDHRTGAHEFDYPKPGDRIVIK